MAVHVHLLFLLNAKALKGRLEERDIVPAAGGDLLLAGDVRAEGVEAAVRGHQGEGGGGGSAGALGGAAAAEAAG